MAWTGTIRIADGVVISDAHTGTVRTADSTAFAVDESTHAFLRSLESDARHIEVDDDSLSSLSLLCRAGIVRCSPSISDNSQSPSPGYRPQLADLIVTKPVRRLGQALSAIATVLGPFVTAAGLAIGLALLVATTVVLVFRIDAYGAARSWLDQPVASLAVYFGLALARLVLHEAGHFRVGRECGTDPRVGVGIYLTGPVLWVDLSPLDTSKLSTRIRGDLAGLAMDGYFLATTTLLATILPAPVSAYLTSALWITLAAVIGSMNPLTRSDFHWFLRDALKGREVTAAWSRPRELLRETRSALPSGRYARLLVGIYVIYSLVVAAMGLKWVLDVLNGWQQAPTMSDLMPLALTLGFVALSFGALKRATRSEQPR